MNTKLKKISSSERFLCILATLLVFGSSNISSQVNFNQTQSIIYDDFDLGLTVKNNNSAAFSEIGIKNDDNRQVLLGITGSTNSFFNSTVSTPYLYNSSPESFIFWSEYDASYEFHADSIHIASVSPIGVVLQEGNPVILESPNGFHANAINTHDEGGLYFNRNVDEDGLGGNIALYIDDNLDRMGVHTLLPLTDFHIRQRTTPSGVTPNNGVSDLAGLTIQSLAGSTASLFVHTDNDLTLTFNSIYRGYWNDMSGGYVAVSDRRTKEDIQLIEPVLNKVLKLRPSKYHFKIDPQSEKFLGFIAQEVEEIFPDIVADKDGTKGLNYDDFAILAIKAIQEQQELINSLAKRIKLLENK